MSARTGATILTAAVLAIFATMPGGATSGTGPRRDADRWTARLEALRPQRPMAYFELAEEISDAAANDGDRQLARRLFGLAGVLDQARLGRSACLALADMEQRPHLARRLRALAALLGDEEAPPPAAVRALTDAFSHYRLGYGERALVALRDPAAAELLERYDRLVPGGARGFLEDCRRYQRGARQPQTHMDDRLNLLRLEAALLSGDRRPFSADLLLNRARPLIEIDPDRLEVTLGVDREQPYFRNGRWVAREG